MIINKYEIMQNIDRWLNSDEECSEDCFTCKYQDICNYTDKLKEVLLRVFNNKI